eukprot:TRINITY_DN4084_c0_g4_i2.p1 TRINITY_DN4084_c0_g4~~TRINITY_DN4084_c0_g4_i2.p1  ORF type:complete len:399 (+),score=66.35 TRINITY_DN4084_c0_g4_i2:79-1197(+)
MPQQETHNTLFHRVAATGIFIPSIAVTWLGSGLVTNVLQMFNFVLVYPFSMNMYRTINEWIVWWWWLIVIWATEWWAEFQIFLYVEEGQHTRNENCILVGNHAGDVDWMMGWYLAEKVGILQNSKAYMKKISKFLPILGWCWYFSDYIFLDRNWNTDKKTLAKTFETMNSYKSNFWLALFAEGTRKSPQKLKESQEWCAKNGKPVLKHVLWPRSKGFISSVQALRGKLESVCVVTIYPDPSALPSFGKLLMAKPCKCHLAIKRTPISEVPSTDEELKTMCEDAFLLKEKDLEYASTHNKFPYPVTTAKRNIGSRISMWFWTIFIQGSLIYFWTSATTMTVPVAIVILHLVLGGALVGMIRYAETDKTKAKVA